MTIGPAAHSRLLQVRRLFRSLLFAPASAVSPIDGKNAALATPILALAEASVRSAAATSGLRSRRSLGSPTGMSGVCGLSGAAATRKPSGFSPTRTARACCCSAIERSVAVALLSTVSSSVSAW